MITAQNVVDLMNQLHALDSMAIATLVDLRVPCNAGLAEHPRVRVVTHRGMDYVGLLGVLNGLIDDADQRAVVAVYSDDGRLLRFALMALQSGADGV